MITSDGKHRLNMKTLRSHGVAQIPDEVHWMLSRGLEPDDAQSAMANHEILRATKQIQKLRLNGPIEGAKE